MHNKTFDMIASSRTACEGCSVRVRRGWMFDLDGVFINLHARRVTEECLIGMLAERLADGEPVTLNTGRSPRQAFEHILRPLACLVDDERLLQRVMLVGEKGGAWATYASGGGIRVSFDTRFSLPSLFVETIGQELRSSDYADALEVEEGKQTMLSVVMRQGASLEAFQKIQGNLAMLLQHCLTQHGLAADWKVDVNGNAVEVEHRLAGKGLGAQRIISWLHAHHIRPSQMIAFGDSLSDLAMGEVLAGHFPIEFVFVGSSEILDAAYPFPIKVMRGQYERGTMEYLLRAVSPVHTVKEVEHA